MKNNWKPVINSFLKIALRNGLLLHSVDNGCEGTQETKTILEASREICATDESHVYFQCPDGKRRYFFIVLGNAPEETICDYQCHPIFDAVVDEFSSKWYGKECPEMA